MLAAELQPGEWVAVEFQLPNAGQALQTKAVVRHHNQLRCGFEFLGLSGDQRSMIRRWAGNSQPLPSLAAAVQLHLLRLDRFSSLPAQFQPRFQQRWQRLWRRKRRPCRRAGNSYAGPPATKRSTIAALDPGPGRGGWRLGGMAMASGMAAIGSAYGNEKTSHAQPPSAKVPTEVMERLLIRKVDPVYPEAARRANLQGTVVLDAVIAADGTVVNLHPVSGPDALVASAMDAARWWRFRPYRVRGEPSPVETTLSIEFHPNGRSGDVILSVASPFACGRLAESKDP